MNNGLRFSIVILTFAREAILADTLDRLAGHLEGRTDYELLLVKGAVPGDVVDAMALEKRKGMYITKATAFSKLVYRSWCSAQHGQKQLPNLHV